MKKLATLAAAILTATLLLVSPAAATHSTSYSVTLWEDPNFQSNGIIVVGNIPDLSKIPHTPAQPCDNGHPLIRFEHWGNCASSMSWHLKASGYGSCARLHDPAYYGDPKYVMFGTGEIANLNITSVLQDRASSVSFGTRNLSSCSW
jgi:hypothetical protein